MIYNHAVVKDGHTYEAGAEVPDLGSFVVTSVHGNVRNYEGCLQMLANCLNMMIWLLAVVLFA